MKLFILLSTTLLVNILVQSQVNPDWVTKIEDPNAQIIAVDHFSTEKLVAVKKYSKQYRVITINKKNGDTTELLKLNGGYYFKITALKSDHSGNVLITGTYKKEMRIASYTKQSETSVIKTFLAKFTPGQPLDTTKIQHFEALETSQLGILPNNDIVLSGFFRYKADILGQHLEGGLDDVFIMKLTPNLKLGWIKNYGTPSDERTTCMHISQDGNIIVAAKFEFKFNLGENRDITVEDGNKHGAAIWKMSPSGNVIWHHVISGLKNGTVEVNEITSDNNHLYLGMYFTRGYFMNGVNFTAMGKKDLLILRLDQKGKNKQLIMHVKSPYDVHIANLKSQGKQLFIGGHFTKRLHINKDLIYAKGDTTGYSFKSDIYYLILDKQSNAYQLNTIGSPNIETCQTVAIDERNFYLSGSFDKSFVWEGFSLKNEDYTADAFIAALSRKRSLNTNNGDNVDIDITTDDIPNDTTQISITDSIINDTIISDPPHSLEDPIEEAEIPESSDTPDQNDEAGNPDIDDDSDCTTPPAPEFTSVIVNTFDLTANWKKIPSATHYELYISSNETFSDTLFQQTKIIAADQPSAQFTGLEGDQEYFLNLIVQTNCDDKRSRPATKSVKTKCDNDTILMSDGRGATHFQIVDCKGKILCMGIITSNDSTLIIGDCIEGTEGIIDSGDGKKRKIGPPKNADDSPCKAGQYTVSVPKPNGGQQIYCLDNPVNQEETHACFELATDEEKLICLAKEGMAKVEKPFQKMMDHKEEFTNISYENARNAADSSKVEERGMWLYNRFEALKDTLAIIRAEYEDLLNAIVIKGNIKVSVKNNGAGFSLEPEAVAYEVRWNKYDDAFKYPGPQLMFSYKTSNYPKEKAKSFGNSIRYKTIRGVQVRAIDSNNKQIGETGTLSIVPCIQVRGSITSNLPILDKYENIDHMEFSNPLYKVYSANLWGECDPDFLNPEHVSEKYLHDLHAETVNNNDIGNIPLHIKLASLELEEDAEYSKAFLFYYMTMTKMEPIYFQIYHNQSTALNFLKRVRNKVLTRHDHSFGYEGLKIYIGFEHFDADIGAKIKAVLN